MDSTSHQGAEASPTSTRDPSKIRAAMAWLQEALAGQPGPAADLERQALAAGHAHSTLAEARRRLSIRSEKRGAAWYWIPPATRRQRKRPPVTV